MAKGTGKVGITGLTGAGAAVGTTVGRDVDDDGRVLVVVADTVG